MSIFDMYSTAEPMFQKSIAPSWVADPLDARRLTAYTLYEAIYWGYPNTFVLQSRGAEDKPIYIPSGRQIVEIMHRYMARKPNIIPDPLFGTTAEQE